MADTQPPRVDNEIVQMWRRDGKLYAIAGFIAGVMLFPLLASFSENLAGFLQELAPEAVGILVTVFLIDRIIRRRDERNAEESLKWQLVMDAGSQSNEKVKDAIYQLRRKQLLTGKDGILQKADLVSANLEAVNLSGANLQGIFLIGANLCDAFFIKSNLQESVLMWVLALGANFQKADLYKANLENANLSEADVSNVNLQMANLSHANLKKTTLQYADLRSADLKGADLQGADLIFSDLQGANFYGCTFDSTTRLPDGSFWEERQDIKRFTDPTHPNFFVPDW